MHICHSKARRDIDYTYVDAGFLSVGCLAFRTHHACYVKQYTVTPKALTCMFLSFIRWVTIVKPHLLSLHSKTQTLITFSF